MSEIINRVKSSSLVTIDINEFYIFGDREVLDISIFLDSGILREKKFRELISKYQWSNYKNKFVSVQCSEDAIIPSWAYMLISSYLSSSCNDYCMGSLKNLEKKLYDDKIKSYDFSGYKDAKVIIKGCSDIPNFEYVYFELTKVLMPLVSGLMYGEPCSTVPIFKNKIK